MPTSFEILGALSFAQGILTLIASIVAAGFSATQQVNNALNLTEVCSPLIRTDGMQARDKFLNNNTQMRDLVQDLQLTQARLMPYLETYGSRSEATTMTINEWSRSNLPT